MIYRDTKKWDGKWRWMDPALSKEPQNQMRARGQSVSFRSLFLSNLNTHTHRIYGECISSIDSHLYGDEFPFQQRSISSIGIFFVWILWCGHLCWMCCAGLPCFLYALRFQKTRRKTRRLLTYNPTYFVPSFKAIIAAIIAVMLARLRARIASKYFPLSRSVSVEWVSKSEMAMLFTNRRQINKINMGSRRH